jgi:hypothetical protein
MQVKLLKGGNNMKKLAYVVLPMIAVALILAGCSKAEEPKAEEKAAAVKCECKCAKDGAFTCDPKDVKDGMCKCPKCGKMVKCTCAPAPAAAKPDAKAPVKAPVKTPTK